MRATERAISVVICAYTEQRWDDVVAAVRSVQAQSLPAHEIVVVVDHNPALRARLAAELHVRVVENQAAPGLSGGKNTGVAVSTGDIVAFLDDDAVAEPDWLRSMATGYDDPAVVGVGGLTLPAWDAQRPSWFPAEFDGVLGCTYVGRLPGPVRNLLGGNASFRREAFEVAGGFAEHIGRSSGKPRPLGCEETEFCIRVHHCLPWTKFLFEPGAVIRHRVPPARGQFAYFRSRCYAEGLSKALVTGSVGVADGLATELTYTAVTLRRGVLSNLGRAGRGHPDGFTRAAAIVVGLACTGAGYVVGVTQQQRTRLRPGMVL
ncbi:MAG TPA: glycosyltransferase family 2 protein [Nocardioidaceae bacterium]|nr:glycosyltransferase family 2 protein [Nocardioidaceae bacterium]